MAKSSSPFVPGPLMATNSVDYHHHHLMNIAPPSQGLFAFNTFKIDTEYTDNNPDSPVPNNSDKEEEKEVNPEHPVRKESSSDSLRKVDYLD